VALVEEFRLDSPTRWSGLDRRRFAGHALVKPAGELVVLGGTDEQKAHWLKMASEVLPATVFTEPAHTDMRYFARSEQGRESRDSKFANRTSFAPETASAKHNERNRNRTKIK
jgi:hypothetical protein